jgi:two-component system chemotaxis response regulator CheY
MGKRILIVDDSVSIRQILSLTLKNARYEVIEAPDGKEALAKLSSSEKVDLIICDVNMPHVDGIAFLKTIKNDEKYANNKFTPIIMLTTESQESKKREGKEAGARAWIVKPFLPDQLLQAVAKLIDV